MEQVATDIERNAHEDKLAEPFNTRLHGGDIGVEHLQQGQSPEKEKQQVRRAYPQLPPEQPFSKMQDTSEKQP